MAASQQANSSSWSIRPATREDAGDILRLINALAVYEKAPEEVTLTLEQLQEDGWPAAAAAAAEAEAEDKNDENTTKPIPAGKSPRFHAFVVNNTAQETSIVAFALAFPSYSTWKGRCLYLEDLYVEPEWRGRGIGTELIRTCARLARETGCARLTWQCLDWNRPSLEFYQRVVGATLLHDWLTLRLDSSGIQQFIEKKKKEGGGGGDDDDDDDDDNTRIPE